VVGPAEGDWLEQGRGVSATAVRYGGALSKPWRASFVLVWGPSTACRQKPRSSAPAQLVVCRGFGDPVEVGLSAGDFVVDLNTPSTSHWTGAAIIVQSPL